MKKKIQPFVSMSIRSLMIVLLASLFTNAPVMAQSNHPTSSPTSVTNVQQKKGPKEVHAMLKVHGSCEMCKKRIEKAALSVKGVQTANWDKDKEMLHLTFNPKKANLNDIAKAVALSGHDNEKFRADNAAYKKLPECCKYRKQK